MVKRIIFVSLLLTLSGCGLPYTKRVAPVLERLTFQDYEKALASLEGLKKDPLLYYLEKGTILHYAGRWQESNSAFDQAEILRENLLIASLREEAISLLTSDVVRSYPGEDFEDVFINYYKMLNYIFLNDLENALVEVRKVGHKLNLLSDRYGGKTRYKSDPFLEYLTGALYESIRDYNNAFISYRRAYEAYEDSKDLYKVQRPDFLIYDLIRTARLSGLNQEVEFFSRMYPEGSPTPPPDGDGELFFIFENGIIPQKEEESIELHIPKKEGSYLLRMAFPKIRKKISRVSKARISIKDRFKETVLMEDLSSIAVKNLEDRKTRETLKVIARSSFKYALTHKAIKVGEKKFKRLGRLFGIIANLFVYASEQADLRFWQSLPQNIQVARLALPKGDYLLKIELIDLNGMVVKKIEYPVTIRDRITFSCYRFWDPPVLQ